MTLRVIAYTLTGNSVHESDAVEIPVERGGAFSEKELAGAARKAIAQAAERLQGYLDRKRIRETEEKDLKGL